MDELTAEKVWEMVKGIDIPKLCDNVGCRRDDPDGPYETVREWSIATDYDGTLSPYQALALIVDAAKREMGEVYRGVNRSRNEWGNQFWDCEFYRGDEYGSISSRQGDTEAQAVLAAYLAWKEGR